MSGSELHPMPSASTSKLSSTDSSKQGSSSQAHGRAQSTRCLHLSNLDPGIDEYLLLKLFKSFGKITKLDHVRHKTGPLRGKPRGFAFVEYETAEEAFAAMQVMNDKAIRGKRLQINLAHVANYDTTSKRAREDDTKAMTPFSLLKSRAQPESTNGKIKALEAKLKKLQQQKELDSRAAQARQDKDTTTNTEVNVAAPGGLPAGLPAKPTGHSLGPS